MREPICVNALCSGICPTCVCSPSREEEDSGEDEIADSEQGWILEDVRLDLSDPAIHIFSV